MSKLFIFYFFISKYLGLLGSFCHWGTGIFPPEGTLLLGFSVCIIVTEFYVKVIDKLDSFPPSG